MDTVHYSSQRSDWPTPRGFYDRLDAEFDFTLDAAASADNAKCARYYTAADDGLAQSWAGEVVYCNPPYGRGIARWIDKAHDEARRGATVVLLLPCRPDTKWFELCLTSADEIRFLHGRLTFEGATTNAPFPSCVVVFRPRNAAEWPASHDVRYSLRRPERGPAWTIIQPLHSGRARIDHRADADHTTDGDYRSGS